MDTTLPSNQQRPTQQPVAQVPVSPPTQQSNEEPKKETMQQISNPNKEFGPMSSSASPSEMGAPESDDDEDEVKVARQEVMLGQKVSPVKEVPVSKELQDIGVEQGEDTEPEIPTVVQHAGMRATSADSAIPVSATASIKLPISYAHAKQLDKRSKIKESIKWLARYIKRQWDRVQFLESHKGQNGEAL